jgi:hypothetical protein
MTPTPDFYCECEAGLMTLLRSLTTYFKHDWQVADDDSVLMKGAEYFAICRPGAFPFTRQTEQLATVNWSVVVDLYVAYKDYKESWNKFKAFRSAIFNLLMEHPTLNDTPGVVRADLTGDERAQYLKFSDAPDATPNFIIQTVRAIITQYIHYSEGEF